MAVGIVGAGLAGLRMAAELRERNFDDAITVWNAEGCEPYDRPPLSKELFGDYLHPLSMDGLGDFAELDVQVIPRAARALRLERDGWTVVPADIDSCADGSLTVDTLVLATGAAPHASIPGARVLYTADDAAALRQSIVAGARVHVVGAGWIGTEIASVAADAGAYVEAWEASEHILDRTFNGAVDALWRTWYEQAGIELHCGVLYNASENPDVLVQATGARPSLAVLAGDDVPSAQLSPRGAVVTDPQGHVLDPNNAAFPSLYAVGDCADVQLPDGSFLAGGHWTAVLGSAARAAACITRTEPPRFIDPPEVFSSQFGHEIGLVGTVPAGVKPVRETADAGFTLRWDSDDTLRALLAVDSPRAISRARRALRRRM